MRVSVSHPGKQHVQSLLQGLQQAGYLDRFFTGFASNSFHKISKGLPPGIQKELKKRFFSGIPSQKISQRVDLFFKEKLSPIRGEEDLIRKVYAPFDDWVSKKISPNHSALWVGYENANLATFRRAKEMGITTVLDLAQIHHKSILEIHEQFGFLDSSYTEKSLDFINSRKEEALNFTDFILTLSSFAKESLIINGIPEERILTVNLGVNSAIFFPKRNYNSGSVFRFLFVGTITRRKGIQVLLEAFVRLNIPDAELVLIGPIADAKKLLSKYEGKFTYFPFLHHQELAAQYRAADVFVFPSYCDSWAQTVIEAMACGTPTIISENTGAKDAVVQGGGFIIPAGNVDALVEKMFYCYENRILLEQMGRNAVNIARQYTLEDYHQQLIAAMDNIIEIEVGN